MPELIELTNGGFALVDAEDVHRVASFKWRRQVSGKSCYAVTGAGILMHRVILDAKLGQQVDHRNGMGLNNTRANLRICTAAENARNRRFFGNTSGRKGVRKIILSCGTVRWAAVIDADGVRHRLGTFARKAAAASAYEAAAMALHRSFARTS
jgi:hypothetical protein